MSAYTTDLLDDALLAGYCFRAVIDALNAGDHTEAGRQLAAVLDLRAADDDTRLMSKSDDDFLLALGARLAVVPVMEMKP